MQCKTWLIQIHEMDTDCTQANTKPEHVAAAKPGGRMSGSKDRGAQTDAKVEFASADEIQPDPGQPHGP